MECATLFESVTHNILCRDGDDADVKTMKASLLASVNERFATIHGQFEQPPYTTAILIDPRFKQKFFTEGVLTKSRGQGHVTP